MGRITVASLLEKIEKQNAHIETLAAALTSLQGPGTVPVESPARTKKDSTGGLFADPVSVSVTSRKNGKAMRSAGEKYKAFGTVNGITVHLYSPRVWKFDDATATITAGTLPSGWELALDSKPTKRGGRQYVLRNHKRTVKGYVNVSPTACQGQRLPQTITLHLK